MLSQLKIELYVIYRNALTVLCRVSICFFRSGVCVYIEKPKKILIDDNKVHTFNRKSITICLTQNCGVCVYIDLSVCFRIHNVARGWNDFDTHEAFSNWNFCSALIVTRFLCKICNKALTQLYTRYKRNKLRHSNRGIRSQQCDLAVWECAPEEYLSFLYIRTTRG